MKNKKFDAVIFDMDGVIVDSMPYHFLAWYEALIPYGVRVGVLDVYSKEGEKWDKSLKDFLQKAGIKPTKKVLKKIFARRVRIFKQCFKRNIFKGAYERLSDLEKKGYRLGLVTGTPAKEVERILPKKIYNLFEVIVAGDHVKKGKPHPEPYLKAAKMLDLKPSECVVVENANYGIRSAKKAGMFCIVLTTSLPPEYLKGADVVADRLDQIQGIISKCGGKYGLD